MRHFAVLAPKYAHGWEWVMKQGDDVISMRCPTGAGEIRVMGVVRPFRIVTRESELRGLDLAGFIEVGYVDASLRTMAQSRVRD